MGDMMPEAAARYSDRVTRRDIIVCGPDSSNSATGNRRRRSQDDKLPRRRGQSCARPISKIASIVPGCFRSVQMHQLRTLTTSLRDLSI